MRPPFNFSQDRLPTVPFHPCLCHPSARALLGALLPLDVHNLGELEIGGIGGEETGRGARAGEADLRVDVEHAVGAAGRPDNRCAIGLVVLEVVAVDGTDEVVLGRALPMC